MQLTERFKQHVEAETIQKNLTVEKVDRPFFNMSSWKFYHNGKN